VLAGFTFHQKFPLDSDPLSPQNLIMACGVYYLWDGECVLYVGASRDVERRLSQHAHNDVPFIQAFYDECAERELLDREAAAIREFRPKLNVLNTCVHKCHKRKTIKVILNHSRNSLAINENIAP
jgi:excinuclease UvrABC nuclease subunit